MDTIVTAYGNKVGLSFRRKKLIRQLNTKSSASHINVWKDRQTDRYEEEVKCILAPKS